MIIWFIKCEEEKEHGEALTCQPESNLPPRGFGASDSTVEQSVVRPP